jgi:hypothetical protein
MKGFAAILLTIVILTQSFSKAIIVMHFNLNRAYIAANLCVKKDIAENTCQGSCQLKKEMEKERNQEQKTDNNKNTNTIQLFCIDNNVDLNQFFSDNATSNCKHYLNNLPPQPELSGVFHPPRG